MRFKLCDHDFGRKSVKNKLRNTSTTQSLDHSIALKACGNKLGSVLLNLGFSSIECGPRGYDYINRGHYLAPKISFTTTLSIRGVCACAQ